MKHTEIKIQDLIEKGIPFPQIEKALGVNFQEIQLVLIKNKHETSQQIPVSRVGRSQKQSKNKRANKDD